MTEHILYGGDVKLVFDSARHQYRIGDKLCPSVTGILDVISKPALVPWAVKMCGLYLEDNLELGSVIDEITKARLIKEMKAAYRKKSGEAADIGSLVHAYAEQYVQGKDVSMPVNVQAKQAAESFIEWFHQHHVKVIHSERKIFSRKHYYAGTVDLIAIVDNALAVIDFKTSSGIYPEMFLQLGGYDIAHSEEMARAFADRRIVIRFPKEGGECEAKDADDIHHDNAGFLAALALFRWQKGIKAA